MAKFTIRTYDAISPAGLRRFSPDYTVSAGAEQPDAILLRSHNLHRELIDESVLAVGRAGAGVNNIPVAELAARGVVVFNAPGANANSVKELVLAGLLLAARNLPAALAYAKALPVQDMKQAVERGKKRFAGHELAGTTLGVIGLGAIGHRVANAAVGLGMRVLGYDPAISASHAVDDAQWLDDATAEILAFALRRSRPRSRRMNAHSMAAPTANMAGTVMSSPSRGSMCRCTESA